MRKVMLCIVLPAILTATMDDVDRLHPTAAAIYNEIVNSSSLYKNISMEGKRLFKSFNPFVRINITKYYMLPELIGWAAYDHPEAVDLSGYNASCLESWSIIFEETINNCMQNESGKSQLYTYWKVCNGSDSDECAKKSRRKGECSEAAINLGDLVEDVVFPDGRRLESLIWNCSSETECCHFGCCPRTEPAEIAKTILFAVVMISGYLCILACLIRSSCQE